jgi:hypothetical protein
MPPADSPDWGQTRWGEDREAAMSAFGSQASLYGEDEIQSKSVFSGLKCRAGISPFRLDGFEFSELRLCFDESGHLGGIDLVASSADFDSLSNAQKQQYGQPVRHDKTGFVESYWWQDTEKKNTIQLIKIVDDTFVHYTPIRAVQ